MVALYFFRISFSRSSSSWGERLPAGGDQRQITGDLIHVTLPKTDIICKKEAGIPSGHFMNPNFRDMKNLT